jgi:toxin ParE1/3/4
MCSLTFGKGFVKKPKFTVRLLRAAEEDLSEIYEYLAAENPRAAEAILSRIEKDLQLLTRQPQLGRIPADEELVRMGYRYLVIGDYLSFYTLEGQTILTHRIIHGARDYLRVL